MKQAEAPAPNAVGAERLLHFRRQIEAKAHVEALRLCPFYLRLRGSDAPPVAVTGSGWRAWARIAGAGFAQPFSAIFGHKSEYIEAMHLHSWHLDTWIKSVRTLYLIDAPGFAAGARQCLNTDDEFEVERFRMSILAVDVQATLAGGALLGGAFDRAIRLVAYAGHPLWTLIGRGWRSVTPYLTTDRLYAAGLMLSPGAGARVYEFLKESREAREVVRAEIEGDPKTNAEFELLVRQMKLSRAMRELRQSLERGRAEDFKVWATKNMSREDVSAAREDLERERAAAPNGAYAQVLEMVLPELEALNLGS